MDAQAEKALTAMESAQSLMAVVDANNRKMGEFIVWLTEALAQENRLASYYHGGKWTADLEVLLAEGPDFATPPAAHQDAICEALDEHHQMMEHLRELLAKVSRG